MSIGVVILQFVVERQCKGEYVNFRSAQSAVLQLAGAVSKSIMSIHTNVWLIQIYIGIWLQFIFVVISNFVIETIPVNLCLTGLNVVISWFIFNFFYSFTTFSLQRAICFASSSRLRPCRTKSRYLNCYSLLPLALLALVDRQASGLTD